MAENAIEVKDLDFQYDNPYGPEKIEALHGVNFELPNGSRTLIVGANGCGKSTLLRLIAGKHLHKKEQIKVFGIPAFQSGDGVSYVGSEWKRTHVYCGGGFYEADIPVSKMMEQWQKDNPERRDELFRILEIDPNWRLHMVSNGQRKRVQIMLQLLRPFKLLLLDEFTTDLDVISRANLLNYLKKECEERGASIIYVTHIFDDMDEWPTHVLLMDSGKVAQVSTIEEVLSSEGYSNMYKFAYKFLSDMKIKNDELEPVQAEKKVEKEAIPFGDRPNCGYTPGRMMHYVSQK